MSCAPIINQRYTDKRGEVVTVIEVTDTRITFIREGYEFPCVQPIGRFTQLFSTFSGGENGQR